MLNRLCGYKIKSQIVDKRNTDCGLDAEYWPDEIKSSELIYPYICILEDKPFMEKTNVVFPYIQNYSENTWEAIRSCIQYGEYREISSLDFSLLISNL